MEYGNRSMVQRFRVQRFRVQRFRVHGLRYSGFTEKLSRPVCLASLASGQVIREF